MNRIKQGIQVAFVYLFLYGLLFGYIVWSIYYGCGPSMFTAAFSAILVCYTFYSTVQFWGEKFIFLWLILFLLSLTSCIFGILSAFDVCDAQLMDNGSKQYQYIYKILFPDVCLLPWLFILGFTSMRYFFLKWKLVHLFFVFLAYNAAFIGCGLYIIAYYILEQNEEYKLIWQIAIGITVLGVAPCCLFILYTLIWGCLHFLHETDQDDGDTNAMPKKRKSTNELQMQIRSNHRASNDKQSQNNTSADPDIHEDDDEYYDGDIADHDGENDGDVDDDDDDEDDDVPFEPHQPFTIWVAIQMITSFLDLWSDILYAVLNPFYSPYLRIACWVFIFFQLVPDFFILLQIVSDRAQYGADTKKRQPEVVWFPMRKKWNNHTHVLERNLLVALYNAYAIVMFFLVATVLMLLKIIPLLFVQNWLFQQNCFKIVQIPEFNPKHKDDEHGGDTIIDLRMHIIFLLFEVLFESVPLSVLIVINSYVLLDDMTYVAWISLAISGYVVLRNIFMFCDDVCLSDRSQRKLYYCL
mmetsp:Transcript_15115/g.22882  ORF Transcript_15115/g.22882 Transcript_15115/m.22882 type:complete len:524 (-) Transcript_15115:147-1718(-)